MRGTGVAGVAPDGPAATGTVPAPRPDTRAPAVVLVGASAGGLAVLQDLLAHLPADLPAAVVVVVHQPREPLQRLAGLLGPGCLLPVREAGPDEVLRPGQVLLAPPDHHLEVVGERVRRSDAPHLHGVRPAVDVLFASAATALGPRVVAVVLSGAMDDGARGAAAVERAGGHVLVQDPEDALVTGMPRNALAATRRHEVATAAGLGAAVTRSVERFVRGGR